MIPNSFDSQTNGFITQWTVGAGVSITLPLVNTRAEGSLSYNCTINWGDGSPLSTVTAYNSASATHTYTNAGIYNVEIRGTCEGWSFNNTGSKLLITAVVYWGDAGGFNGFKYLKGAFHGCSNLASLGKGVILPGGTGILTDGFYRTFTNCSALTSIPTDLFRYNTAISSNGFYETFFGCSALTTIPIDLFRYNTAVSSNGFYATFSGCSALTSVPTNLFRYNTLCESFYQTFVGCSALTAVPADLFRYNTLCTSFYQTFYACTKLQVLSNIFYESGEETTRFLNSTMDFTSCFARISFSGVQGTAPDLWTCDFGETITLSTAPATDWAPGDTIKGQTSGATALVVSKVSSLVYKIKQHLGTFTLGETVGVTGVPAKLAAQNGTHPTFSGTPTSSLCFGDAGNNPTSLSNYASIPSQWE